MDTDYILDDNTSTSNTTDDVLVLDTFAKSYLEESAKWGKFIAIVGFVFIGLAVVGIFMVLAGGLGHIGGVGALGAMMLVYLVFLGFMVLPFVYLYNFAQKTKIALRDNHQGYLRDALENHKSLFKFYGILTIISIVFYGIAIISSIVGGLASFL